MCQFLERSYRKEKNSTAKEKINKHTEYKENISINRGKIEPKKSAETKRKGKTRREIREEGGNRGYMPLQAISPFT